MHWSETNGVYFVEGLTPGAKVLRPISTQLDGMFSSSQLKTLADLKAAMAKEVLSAGGNAVLEFKYGQKSSFWKSLLSVDDVFWHGSGTIANINASSLSARSR